MMSAKTTKKKKGDFPFPIIQVCALCASQVASCGSLCSGVTPHVWMRPKYRHPITQLVVRSPKCIRHSYSLCRDIKQCRDKEQCSFAHNVFERAIWTWMAEKEVYDLDIIFNRYTITQYAGKELEPQTPVSNHHHSEIPSDNYSAGSWTIIKRKPSTNGVNPIKLIVDSREANRRLQNRHLFCGACCKQLPDLRAWKEHVNSKEHHMSVRVMRERNWLFRPPSSLEQPFQRCKEDEASRSCFYSKLSYSENLCKFAHSQEELAEWKERIRFKKFAKIFPTDDILPPKFELLPDYLPNLRVESDVPWCQSIISDRPVTIRWKFTVTLPSNPDLPSTGPLPPQWSIILCVRAFCLNFFITASSSSNFLSPTPSPSPKKVFRIHCQDLLFHEKLEKRFVNNRQLLFEVLFESGSCGSYHQIVVLDLGQKRRVKIPLNVDVTTPASFKTFQNFIRPERWELDQMIVIPYNEEDRDTERREYEDERKIDISEVRNLERSFTLQPNNYKVVWHSLMYLESAYRQNLLVDLPVTNLKLKLTDVIAVSGLTIAIPGTLFAELDFVKNQFTEKISSRSSSTSDTDPAAVMADFNSILLLLQTAVRYAWLCSSSQSQEKKVYAVQVVDEERFGVDAKLASSVYLHLPRHCLADHPHWTKDKEITVDLQFRLDMRFFKEIHDAIDDTVCDDQGSVVVMPHSEKILTLKKLPLSQEVLSDCDPDLDQMQNQIRRAISEPSLPRFTPPFVMFGCFGAGKTQTIGRTVLSLLSRQSDTGESPPRILICTHNNCAADLYITRYLHPFIISHKNRHIKLIRLYYHMRKFFNKTPDQQICNQYALRSTDGMRYRSVCEEDVRGVHVIVTTLSTSFQLRNIPQLVPEFKLDYIFIDEAAQVLEVEVLTPLMLLTEKTKVIVAGDTMQVTPKLFCPEVRDCAVDSTILLRLYKLYDHLEERPPPRDSLLKINFLFVMKAVYRSHSDIVNFLSAAFYKRNLHPKCPPISLPNQWPALSICCVYGANPAAILSTDFPTQHYSGGVIFQPHLRSCICESEALGVVGQVYLLCKMWPSDWPRTPAGGPDISQICVVSDEFAQVKLIRSKLREKRLHGVVVENLRNIQGREFQAVFVSPVHTRDHYLIGRDRFDETCSSNQLFSDIRVINTTISRAKALVQVVGDPVGLALINEQSSAIWRKFIGHCGDSLRLQGIDFGELRRVVTECLSGERDPSSMLQNEVFLEEVIPTKSSSTTQNSRPVSSQNGNHSSQLLLLNPDAISFKPGGDSVPVSNPPPDTTRDSSSNSPRFHNVTHQKKSPPQVKTSSNHQPPKKGKKKNKKEGGLSERSQNRLPQSPPPPPPEFYDQNFPPLASPTKVSAPGNGISGGQSKMSPPYRA